MQPPKNYITPAAVHIEHALNRTPIYPAKRAAYMRKEVIHDIEELLTREEQQICNLATD